MHQDSHSAQRGLKWVSKENVKNEENSDPASAADSRAVVIKVEKAGGTPAATLDITQAARELANGSNEGNDSMNKMLQKFLSVFSVCNIELESCLSKDDESTVAELTKNLKGVQSFKQPAKKEMAWNYKQWEGTDNLAEAAGDEIEKIVAGDVSVDEVAEIMVNLVLEAVENGGDESTWFDVGAVTDSVIDQGTGNFDEEEVCQLGALLLDLATVEGSKTRARHELVGVLRAMTFLQEPLETLQEHEEHVSLALDVAEALSKAGLFISVMAHAPSPHTMIRAPANQRSLNAYEEELKQLALLTYTKCFPILVYSRGTGAPFAVPHPRNPRFSGREPVLQELAMCFSGQKTRAAVRSTGIQVSKVRVLTLSGPSGIGKTEVALEFAYRNAAAYDGVLWVDAHPAVLEYNFVALKSCLDIQVIENDVMARKVEDVRVAVERGGKLLLILDNVKSKEMDARLDRLLPKAGAAHILITSETRVQNFSEVVLAPFQEEEAWELLTLNTKVAPEDSTVVEEIGQRVFAHPQGLKAAACLLRSGYPAQGLLQQLKSAPPFNPLEGPPNPEGMFRKTSAFKVVLDLWLESIRSLGGFEALLAVAMFDAGGWFGEQPIPLPLLSYAACLLLGHEPIMEEEVAEAGLKLLVDSGIVQHGEKSDKVAIHAGLQDYARSRPRARAASKAVLDTILESRCYEDTTLHFGAVWENRKVYDASRSTMGLTWKVAAELARYWARTNQMDAALALCEEVIALGPRVGDRCEFLFLKAYLLGAGREAKADDLKGAAELLNCEEIAERSASEDAYSVLIKTLKLQYMVLHGNKHLDEVKDELEELEGLLSSMADQIPPRDVQGPLKDYCAVTVDGRFLVYGLTELARLVVEGGISFSYGGDKWLERALEIQRKSLLLINRALPLLHPADLLIYSSAAALYFRLYGIAVAQEHFHDCFRPILKPQAAKAPEDGLQSKPGGTPSPPKSSNPLHRAAFSDAPPEGFFSDTDEDDSSEEEEEEKVNAIDLEAKSSSGKRGRINFAAGLEAIGELGAKVGPKVRGKLQEVLETSGRGGNKFQAARGGGGGKATEAGSKDGGSAGAIIVDKVQEMEEKWGYGCRPQWLTAGNTFGSIYFTPQRQREAWQVFSTVIQLARKRGDRLLEAQSFTQWALAVPNTPHTAALLAHCKRLLIEQLKLLPGNPRLCVAEKHALRVLLAHVYFELAGLYLQSPKGGSKDVPGGKAVANGGAALAEDMRGANWVERRWEGLADEGRGLSDPSLDPPQRAVQFLRNCLSIAERTSPDYIALYSLILGLSLIQLGSYLEAQSCFKRTLGQLEARERWRSPVKLAQVLGHLASVHWLMKQVGVAKGHLERARSLLDQPRSGMQQLLMADILDALGRVYAFEGHLEPALDCLSQSRKTRLAALGPKHPAISFTMADMANVQEDLGKKVEADRLRLSAFAELGGHGEPDVTALRARLQATMGQKSNAVQQFFLDKLPSGGKK